MIRSLWQTVSTQHLTGMHMMQPNTISPSNLLKRRIILSLEDLTITVALIAEDHDVAVRNEEELAVDMLVNFYRYDRHTIDTFKHHLIGWGNRCKECLLAIYHYIRDLIKTSIAFKGIIYVESAMVIYSYVKTSAWISVTFGGGLIKYEQKTEVVY